MYSNKKLKSSLEEKQKDEKERRMERREQWHREQKALKEHEERKVQLIQNFERNRAQEIAHKQRLQQNESNNPQRRTEYPEELKISTSKYQRSTIIEEKELKKIKVKIYCEETHKTRNKNISTDKIERDICNPNDIVLQRREYESICPIFEKIKTAQDKMQTLRDDKLEKKVSDEESIDIWKNKSIDKYKIIPQYRLHRSSSRQDQADDEYKSERKQSRSTRKNEEEERSRNKRRTRSSSRCNSDIASTVRDRSRFRRSRSNSSSNRTTKEEQDFNEDKFSSRRNRSHKPYDRVSHAELAARYSSSYNFYDTCMRFPGQMPMYRMQTPPMMWPIAPRPFLPPFPPNMIRWRSNSLRVPNVNRGFYRN